MCMGGGGGRGGGGGKEGKHKRGVDLFALLLRPRFVDY